MKYSEYRETYKEAIKAYPEITSLYRDSEDVKEIHYTEKHYTKTGSRWILTEERTEDINFIFYSNIVDPRAIRFFRNLGGLERISKSYTKAGYLPVEVSSTNPSRDEKTVRTFTF